MREKLIELVKQGYNKYFNPNWAVDFFAMIADHLIAHGVTINEDCHWATEQAYKNGYAKGYEDGKAACVSKPTRFFIKAQHSVDSDLMEKLMSGSAIIPVTDETIIPIYPCRWIPVTERLPDRWQNVLSVSKYGKHCVDYVFTDGSWWSGREVTHWMPLPEPPKEDDV